METVPLNRLQVGRLIADQRGKFIGVTFFKQDGTLRNLCGRLGVHTSLSGGVNTVERPDRPYVTIFDVQNNGYRTVNLETVRSIRAGLASYSVV